MLDDLQPEEPSEALEHLNTIRILLSPLKAQAGYHPVGIAMAANLCERYRLIQEDLSCEKSCDSSNSGTTAGENQAAEPMWWKIFIETI